MGGIEYYEAGDEDASVVISVGANQVLLSVVPTKAKSLALGRVLGIEKPANSLAGSGRLDSLNEEFDLSPYGTLLVDTQRLVQAVQAALAHVGVDPSSYTGHSFRIGAATTAAARGLEDSVIKTLGRWESSAYLRPAPQTAAVHEPGTGAHAALPVQNLDSAEVEGLGVAKHGVDALGDALLRAGR